jgi:NSS family neurotransmitter:Na+ symporter
MGAEKSVREEWVSRLGFLLTMLGAMVGLGNIWRFPYVVGSNGGGAFLVAYVVLLFVVAVPGLMGEAAMGRFAGAGATGTFRRMAGFSAPGVVVTLATFGIMTYYFPVIGWVIHYFAHAAAGTFFTAGFDSAVVWETFKSEPNLKLACHAAAVLLCGVPLYCGVSKGLERASLVMVPAFFVALAVTGGRALTLDGSSGGVSYLFTPDWTQLAEPGVWLAAMGQVLFSTGLGWGIALTLGSYLSRSSDIPLGAGIFTALGDTSISLLAGLVVLPTVFAFGVDPTTGPELIFVSLPQLFPKMPAGYLWCLLFFTGFLFAGLTSGFAVMEVPVAVFREESGLPRKQSVMWMMGAVWLLGLPSALDFSFNELMDFVFGNWMLPLATLATMLTLGWRFGATKIRVLEVNYGADLYIGPWWDVAVRYFIPLSMASLLVWFTVDAFQSQPPFRTLGGLGFVAGFLVVSWLLGRLLDRRKAVQA